MLYDDDFFVFGQSEDFQFNSVKEITLDLLKSGIQHDIIEKSLGSILRNYASLSKPLFRKSADADFFKQSLWRINYFDSANRDIRNSIIKESEPISIGFLSEIAKTSTKTDFFTQVTKLLNGKGIFIVLVNAIAGTKIDGAVSRTPDDRICIGMSLRYDRLDYFYFTLLHELAHICLHDDLLKNGIISDEDEGGEIVELEANRFAKEAIVAPSSYRTLSSKRSLNKSHLLSEADKLNIHPALLAGIIRRDLNRYDVFSDIVNEVSVRGKIYG